MAVGRVDIQILATDLTALGFTRAAANLKAFQIKADAAGATMRRSGAGSANLMASAGNNLETSIARTTTAVQKQSSWFQRNAMTMRMIGHDARMTGQLMTRYLTIPILGIAVASAKMSYDFDTAMTRVRSLTDASATDMKMYYEYVQKYGEQFGIAPKAAADALYFIASSGIRGAKALDILKYSMMDTVSGMGDMTSVAGVLTSVMVAWGNTNITAAKASDIFVAAIREGKVAPTEFAKSLGRVIPIASALNVPFSQVAAGIAVLTRIGMSARFASFGMRAFFMTFTKPTKGTIDTLKSLHLNVDTLRKDLGDPNIGVLGVMQQIWKSAKGNVKTLAKIFPMQALNAFLATMHGSPAAMAKIYAETGNSAKASLSAWAKAQQMENVKFKIAWSTLQFELIKFGNKVMPFLVGVVKEAAKLATWFNNLSPATQHTIEHLAIMLALLGPILQLAGNMAYWFGTISHIIGGIVTRLAAARAASAALGAANIASGAEAGAGAGAARGAMRFWSVGQQLAAEGGAAGTGAGVGLLSVAAPIAIFAGAVAAFALVTKHYFKPTQVTSKGQAYITPISEGGTGGGGGRLAVAGAAAGAKQHILDIANAKAAAEALAKAQAAIQSKYVSGIQSRIGGLELKIDTAKSQKDILNLADQISTLNMLTKLPFRISFNAPDNEKVWDTMVNHIAKSAHLTRLEVIRELSGIGLKPPIVTSPANLSAIKRGLVDAFKAGGISGVNTMFKNLGKSVNPSDLRNLKDYILAYIRKNPVQWKVVVPPPGLGNLATAKAAIKSWAAAIQGINPKLTLHVVVGDALSAIGLVSAALSRLGGSLGLLGRLGMYLGIKFSTASGGIMSGPITGYPVMLHGTEVVTPLSRASSSTVSKSPLPKAGASKIGSSGDTYNIYGDVYGIDDLLSAVDAARNQQGRRYARGLVRG